MKKPSWIFEAPDNGFLFGQCNEEKLGLLEIDKYPCSVEAKMIVTGLNSFAMEVIDVTEEETNFFKKILESIFNLTKPEKKVVLAQHIYKFIIEPLIQDYISYVNLKI